MTSRSTTTTRSRGAALREALDAVYDGTCPTEITKRLTRAGWTGQFVVDLQELTRLAIEHDTDICHTDTRIGPTLESTVYHLLAMRAERWHPRRLPPQVALGWLTIAAFEPMHPIYVLDTVNNDDVREQWTRHLGYTLGPLAYAAGLTIPEAVTRRDTGSLDLDELRLLAALRGYPIPPPAPDLRRRGWGWTAR